MRWYYVFLKGVKEQIRDFWILLLVILMVPIFIFLYYLMVESETPGYDIVLVNRDNGIFTGGCALNLGDSLIHYARLTAIQEEMSVLHCSRVGNRDSALALLERGAADVAVVFPEDFTRSLLAVSFKDTAGAVIEVMGDVTQAEYVVGAVWAEELVNRFVQEVSGIRPPVTWKETTLGYSGQRSMFELYVPGLLVLSIIMIIFSASSAIVREPESRTLERLKISRLTSLEFLAGTSLVQIIIALVSLALAILTAMGLGYTLIPGTFWYILLISFLTALSMISFSLIVAAMCRSVKEVAIIGTFPLFLLMFFTGAAFPISGGKLFVIGSRTVMLNDILSPTWAVDALNKVLVKGAAVSGTIPEMTALVVLTLVYFLLGMWAFRCRHMRAQ
jgi:ABC-2 type transport system permease protein